MLRPIAPALLIFLCVVTPQIARAQLDAEQTQALLQRIEERQRSTGDFKALVFIEHKERDKNDLVYESVIYRRDHVDKLLILFLKPRTEAGKGYLKIEKNLWMYDPTVGKWERRTERERIGGTDSRRADFAAPRYTRRFTWKYVGPEQLGRFKVHRVRLDARPDADVAFPIVDIWIDQATENVLKQQERALSGRLMRTIYYPKWEKMHSPSKGTDLYYPREIRAFDEVEKGNRTLVVVKRIDLRPLADNLFTKAWLESKSR